MEQAGPAMESLIKEIGEMAASTSDVDVSFSPATRVQVFYPDDCLISLVKEETRDANPPDYSPAKVYIGPYYYSRRSTDPYLLMEKEKKELLQGFLPSDERKRQDRLRSYLMAMAVEDVEGRARQYYNDTFSKMSKDEFACMLLLDGCYLLAFLGLITVMDRGRLTSSVTDKEIAVDRDVVFLLENQIPFFVLGKIHKLITGGAQDDESIVLRSVANHVEKLVQRNHYSVNKLELDRAPRRPCHLLHLLYMYFRPTQARDDTRLSVEDGNSHVSINRIDAHVAPARRCTATDCHVTGVQLVKRDLDGDMARSVLDVELTGRTLHIPCLTVDKNTLTILRNMVALEQNSPSGSPQYVTAYCLFMSQLASKKEDVALLVAKEIVVHDLGNDSIFAEEFGKFCNGFVLNVNNPDFSYLRREQEALEELCWDGWRRWRRWRKAMVWLRHTKCNNPLMVLKWSGKGIAVVAFVCAMLQTVFAVLSYAKGNNS